MSTNLLMHLLTQLTASTTFKTKMVTFFNLKRCNQKWSTTLRMKYTKMSIPTRMSRNWSLLMRRRNLSLRTTYGAKSFREWLYCLQLEWLSWFGSRIMLSRMRDGLKWTMCGHVLSLRVSWQHTLSSSQSFSGSMLSSWQIEFTSSSFVTKWILYRSSCL